MESPVDYEGPSLEESRPSYLPYLGTDIQVLKQLPLDEGDERTGASMTATHRSGLHHHSAARLR